MRLLRRGHLHRRHRRHGHGSHRLQSLLLRALR
ncbi:hypothetical protein FOMG_19833 [Fusarium oxysporum f. sp. melonis 26406]|uniref:Uncharacterized protein n=1 Tax=Fusarium oxysporum f. sp. melonis 26406 TaxID=1089452 RepID=W9Z415_FUSOX|nr:hypothetical protein FOMG_19833 [Fusarium oxysporum f. sp. melonis 26406]